MSFRKQEILEEAMALIIREGIAPLTMKSVAEQVGFTETAMYRHFRGKSDLVISLIRLIRERFDEMFAGISLEERPDVFFQGLLCPMLEYMEQVRGVTIQFLSESTYNRDEAIREELYDFLGSMIQRIAAYLKAAQDRKTVRQEMDCEAAAVLFTGILQSLTIRYLLSGRTSDLAGKCQAVLDVFLRGVME